MKDDGRKRQFVIRERREESYDDPSVKRKGFVSSDRQRVDETPEPPKLQRQRKSLRERELEEEEENNRNFRRTQRRDEDEDFEEIEDEYEDRPSKAPKVVRIFAWAALMAILFAGGYLATNFFFNWSDRKGGERIGSVYGSGSEVKAASVAASGDETSSNIKYTLYVPDGTSFKNREIDITRGNTREEDIKKVISMYVDTLKETKSLDPSVSVNAVYQSGDILYLDMSNAFPSSLKSAGKVKASQVLDGMLRTASSNFPPAARIKFYVNAKEIQDKVPLDLTKPWEGSK